jgi:hypothetical protein
VDPDSDPAQFKKKFYLIVKRIFCLKIVYKNYPVPEFMNGKVDIDKFSVEDPDPVGFGPLWSDPDPDVWGRIRILTLINDPI